MNDKKNTNMAVLAYFLFFLPLLTEAKKDEFVRFHVRQSLGLVITFLAIRLLMILFISPLLGVGIFFDLFLTIVNLGFLTLFIIGVMSAAKGEKRPLPLIGVLADKMLKF